MFCTTCGNQLPHGASICPNCGVAAGFPASSPGTATAVATMKNYLIPAVLVTLCCCMPFGVVAIVFAAQVNTKLAAGDVAGAEASAKNAKLWCWIGFGCGVLVAIGYGILSGAAFLNQR